MFPWSRHRRRIEAIVARAMLPHHALPSDYPTARDWALANVEHLRTLARNAFTGYELAVELQRLDAIEHDALRDIARKFRVLQPVTGDPQ